jgi:hypothetical protein
MISISLTKRGMHWKRSNAIAIVALWVQVINAGWEAAAAEHPIVGGTEGMRDLAYHLSLCYP